MELNEKSSSTQRHSLNLIFAISQWNKKKKKLSPLDGVYTWGKKCVWAADTKKKSTELKKKGILNIPWASYIHGTTFLSAPVTKLNKQYSDLYTRIAGICAQQFYWIWYENAQTFISMADDEKSRPWIKCAINIFNFLFFAPNPEKWILCTACGIQYISIILIPFSHNKMLWTLIESIAIENS